MKSKILFYLAMLEAVLYSLWLKIAPWFGEAFLWVADFIVDNWRAILAFVVGYLLGG